MGDRNGGDLSERLRERDELYEPAIEIILREARGSVSLLQRALGIGYGRAARLIDFMAEDGIVGGYNGSNAREVLYTPETWATLKAGAAEGGLDRLKARDSLYESAIDVIVREGRGSVSLLQRALGIGYGRAARLVDFMAEDGIVGAYNGSNAREVLMSPEQWAAMRGIKSEGPE